MQFRLFNILSLAVCVVGVFSPASVIADDAGETYFFGQAVTRYESADNQTALRKATGLTQSLRAAVETKVSRRLSFLAEGEAVIALIDNFNDGSGNNPDRLVIPDPNTLELNRIQLQYAFTDQSFITVGRQTLAVDDQRFIGPAAFRQNRQTFEGVHFSHRFGTVGTFQAGYFNKVNRVLGGDNANGRFRGDSYFVTGNIQTPIGRVGAFHYAFDLETGTATSLNSALSSQTTGVRLDGRFHKNQIGIDWEASYAEQRDYADNPFDYQANYWLVGAQLFVHETRFGFRSETLGGGDGQSFQTPLSNLRKFQGFADLFLLTPIDGVVDNEASFVWEAGTHGAFSRISAKASYHWFSADRGGASYGTEFDLTINGTYADNILSIGIAAYDADTFATNTTRIFLSLTRHF